MSLIIRLAEENELSHVAELISMATSRPITAADLIDELKYKTAGTVWHWWVALQEGQVVGAAQAVHFGSQAAGRFGLLIAVAPPWRRKGIGRKLLTEVQTHLLGQNGTRIVSQLGEKFVDGLAFAQSQGFEIFKRTIASSLPLTTFDLSQFPHTTNSENLAEVRITTYANVENSEQNQRLLHAINHIALVDDPGELDVPSMPFESWKKIVLEASWFDPAGQIIAIAEDKFVGLSSLSYEPDTKTAETGVTGVDRTYRGRGLAFALKLEAIRYAQTCGAQQLITENDSNNAPMLAINKKLGFVPQKGDDIYTLIQAL